MFSTWQDIYGDLQFFYGPELGSFGPAHEFLIGRGAQTYHWRVIYDSVDMVAPYTTWWTGTNVQFGGEIAQHPITTAPYPFSNTFDMLIKAQLSNGVWLAPPGSGLVAPGLNGVQYYSGEWSWNTA